MIITLLDVALSLTIWTVIRTTQLPYNLYCYLYYTQDKEITVELIKEINNGIKKVKWTDGRNAYFNGCKVYRMNGPKWIDILKEAYEVA